MNFWADPIFAFAVFLQNCDSFWIFFLLSSFYGKIFHSQCFEIFDQEFRKIFMTPFIKREHILKIWGESSLGDLRM